MAEYIPPKKNTAFIFYCALVSQSNPLTFQANPTLAAGDVKVEVDGTNLGNITTLPSAVPASGTSVKVQLSTDEMNGDNIVVRFSDAAGAEWCDTSFFLQTGARQIVDLAYPQTSGRGTLVAADGSVSPNWGDVKSPTTTVGLSGTTIATSQVVASVSGAVGSVTGAVGSVTGNVSGNVTGSVGSLATQAKADVNAEVVDCLSVDTYAEPTGAPAATTTIAGKLGRLYQMARNKLTVSSTTKTFTDDAGSALWTKTLSDDGSTYTENEGS